MSENTFILPSQYWRIFLLGKEFSVGHFSFWFLNCVIALYPTFGKSHYSLFEDYVFVSPSCCFQDSLFIIVVQQFHCDTSQKGYSLIYLWGFLELLKMLSYDFFKYYLWSILSSFFSGILMTHFSLCFSFGFH